MAVIHFIIDHLLFDYTGHYVQYTVSYYSNTVIY
jgi:hypothetical protein